MKKILIVVIGILSLGNLFAQVDTIFYNSNWELVEFKDSTVKYFSINDTIDDGKGLKRKDFFISGQLQKEGEYTKGKYSFLKTGIWKTFHNNGNLESKGFYKNSRKDGYWKNWHVNGEIKSAGSYKEDKKNGLWNVWYDNNVKEEILNFEDSKKYYISRWNKDGSVQIEEGNGIYTSYFQSGNIETTGSVLNEEKDGEWKTFDVDQVLINWELYKKGEFIEGISYKDGEEYPYVKKQFQPYTKSCAELKNIEDRDRCGMRVIQLHTMRIDYPQLALDNDIQGVVFISFVINTKGEVADVKILRGTHKLLDDTALNHIKNLPKFIPGREKGIPANIKFNIPITFKLG